MDLKIFRQMVDQCGPGITVCQDDLAAMFTYVGLEPASAMTKRMVTDALHKKCGESFSSGHQSVWKRCKLMLDEMIQHHVIEGEPLEPYFSILTCLRDANRIASPSSDIVGDWPAAIRYACDSRNVFNLPVGGEIQERGYRKSFEPAKAAKRFLAAGVAIDRIDGELRFTPESEARVVAEIERRVASMGGVSVARRIFKAISPNHYDTAMERYHIGRISSPSGEGVPLPPIGYLLQLAAKHFNGKKPLRNSTEDWTKLVQLATDYAAVLDVQTYGPVFFWGGHDAVDFFQMLREIAVHDALFCIPQMRASDVIDISKGIFDGIDFTAEQSGSWTINEVFAIIARILDRSRDIRGPLWIGVDDLGRELPDISSDRIANVMARVLSHPASGPNQRFSKPTDAQNAIAFGPGSLADDFFKYPLINDGKGGYLLLDRSMCAPAFLEALINAMKPSFASPRLYSAKLGLGVEQCLKKKFASKGIETPSGKYHVYGEDGDCDLVVETEQVIFFIEVKKKSLTPMARAGSDVFVILDLARSALKAQVQAGWHELRIRRRGHLNLVDGNDQVYQLNLSGRKIERIAVSLPDYGSFQDRNVLMGFLESNIGAQYSVSVSKYQNDFDELNELLNQFKEQENELRSMRGDQNFPFYNCWFLSLPQLLILLDDVSDAEAFKAAIWSTRGTTTGSLDFYREYSWMKNIKAKAAAELAVAGEERSGPN